MSDKPVYFTIKIRYETGGTFETYTTTDKVGYVWTNIDKVKDALVRIKEHYAAKTSLDNRYISNAFKKFKKERWFCKDDEDIWEHYLILQDDEGNPIKLNAFWCGYFETLYSAEIIIDSDDEEYVVDF